MRQQGVVDNAAMQVNSSERLRADEVSGVQTLVEAATRSDGVAPLSEQVLLTLRGDASGSVHFLAYDGTHLAGYAHLERGLAGDGGTGENGEAATGEVVVDPESRRQGVGTALINALEDALTSPPDSVAEQPDPTVPQRDSAILQMWSHGHLDAAAALLTGRGYAKTRDLWSMSRPLGPDAAELPEARLPEARLPEGFTSRHFVVGQDEDAWLGVNARAFVDHPEQGRMTRLDLDARIAQPWFDETGLILIEDLRGPTPVLAASHWTKVVPAADPEVSPTEGEVYVVGVDPAYQGLGLGRAVTVLGLAHLLGRGLSGATLYVDADNAAAVATYARLGFTHTGSDVMYARVVHRPVSG